MKHAVRPLNVEGFQNLYGCGEDGWIWSLPRTVRKPGSAPYMTKLQRLMPRVGNDHGHLRVTLYDRNGVASHHWVHRLVALTWCEGRTADKDFVLHGPNGPTDNRASQLRWGTRSENELDKGIHRRMKAKLDPADNPTSTTTKDDSAH